MSAARVDERVLFSPDEAVVMFPVERAATVLEAKHMGWHYLREVDYVEGRFLRSRTFAEKAWMRQFDDDPCAEVTHRFCEEGDEGAALYWVVEVDGA